MTDTTTPSPTVAQQIERMVSGSAARADRPGQHITTAQDLGGMRITVDPETRQTTSVITDGVQPSAGARDIGTTSLEAHAEQQSIGRRYNELKSQYDAHTFDPRSGEKVYEHAPERRAMMEKQLSQLVTSGEYQANLVSQLRSQEAAETSRRAQIDSDAAAKHAFTKGNPTLAAAWDESMAKAEADKAVALALANRNR